MNDGTDSFTLQGYWRSPTDPQRRIAGSVRFDPASGASLELSGRLRRFQSYLPGGVGAPSARSVVLGRSSEGEPLSLMNAVEVAHRRWLTRKGSTNRERATYRSSLLVRGRHVPTWEELTFRALSFGLRDLHRCLGKSGFVWHKQHEPGVERITYRRPKSLSIRFGGFSVVASYGISTTGDVDNRSVREDAQFTVTTDAKRVHYAEFVRGPIRTLRTFCEFGSTAVLPVTSMVGTAGARRYGRPVELLFRREDADADHARWDPETAMFTLGDLPRTSLERAVGRWHAAQASLSPIPDLFAALLTRSQLDTELRFLTLVYMLEAFHRLRSVKAAPSPFVRALVDRLTENSPPRYQPRVLNLLGNLGTPSLHRRLSQLCEQLPTAFLNPMGPKDSFFRPLGPGPDFISEVVNTRNYLTHLDHKKRAKALTGFPLFRAAARLDWLFRYLLLRYLGFRRRTANGFVLKGAQSWVKQGFSTILPD